MSATRVEIAREAWYGDTELKLAFPASWEVYYLNMSMEQRPRLSHAGMCKHFKNL